MPLSSASRRSTTNLIKRPSSSISRSRGTSRAPGAIPVAAGRCGKIPAARRSSISRSFNGIHCGTYVDHAAHQAAGHDRQGVHDQQLRAAEHGSSPHSGCPFPTLAYSWERLIQPYLRGAPRQMISRQAPSPSADTARCEPAYPAAAPAAPAPARHSGWPVCRGSGGAAGASPSPCSRSTPAPCSSR